MRLLPRGQSERRAQRRARRLRGPRAWRRALLLWGGLVVTLAGVVVFVVFYSAAFVVKDIRVEGVEGEIAESVKRHADIPRGRPLARVSEARLSDRVLAGDKRVRSVSLSREWPSTIVYEAELREPALALHQGGSSWLADVGGVVYDQVDKPSNKLPSVTVSAPPEDLPEETVRGLVELWRLRPDPAVLEGELATPEYDARGQVTITIDRLTVLWGEPTEADKKWSVVAALVGQESIDPQGAVPQTIDVRLPDSPVVTGLPAAQG